MESKIDSSDSDDWNVESYRGQHESVEHWELRKQFMIENKGKFEEVRLVCLSQVFANMEFLGCKYPLETMELVAELSQGIVEDYREKQKGRLQRTFVKASDAAERKTKGQKRPPDSNCQSVNKVFVRESSIQIQPQHTISDFHMDHDFTADSSINDTFSNNLNHLSPSISDVSEQFSELELTEINGLVIVEHPNTDKSTVEILFRSCGMSHKQLTLDYSCKPTSPMELSESVTCTCRIGNFAVTGTGCSKDVAKVVAVNNILEKLRQVCYTIQIKRPIAATERQIDKKEISNTAAVKDKPISDDNIGNKLLRLMGWDGGGLGKNNQGTKDTINVDNCVGRLKMGLGSSSLSVTSIKAFLTKEINENGLNELVFSSEFTSDERKIIHRVASEMKIKSRSYGKGENRFLVLFRKIELMDLVGEILASGETDKYRVIKPTYSYSCNNS